MNEMGGPTPSRLCRRGKKKMKRIMALLCALACCAAAFAETDGEAALRSELARKMGMPPNTVLKNIWDGAAGEYCGDDRPCRCAVFQSDNAGGLPAWQGCALSQETGKLVAAEWVSGMDWISREPSVRLDPDDPGWAKMARECVVQFRQGGAEIRQVIVDGEKRDSVYGVSVRVIMADGGVYTVWIIYEEGGTVAQVTYRDDLLQRLYEEYMEKLTGTNG